MLEAPTLPNNSRRIEIFAWPLLRVVLVAVQHVTHQYRVVFVQESNPEEKPADCSKVAGESVVLELEGVTPCDVCVAAPLSA
jgi:hypothetical protein